MNGRILSVALLVLVLVALFACMGTFAFNSGMAQGSAQSGTLTTPGPSVPPYPYYGPFFYHPFGWGFGLFGFLVPLFLFFLFFGLLRALFWRGRWGWHGPRDYGQGVPPAFEEWHRRAHASTSQER